MSNPYDNNPYAQHQQPYVQASPYGGQMAQPHPQGTLVLIFGILSLVGITILGPFAWYMGNKALKEIDANPAAYSDRNNVNIGKILGMIGSILLIIGVVALIVYIIFIVVVIAAAGASSGF